MTDVFLTEGGGYRNVDGSEVGVGPSEAGGVVPEETGPAVFNHGESAGERHQRVGMGATRDGGDAAGYELLGGGVQHVRIPEQAEGEMVQALEVGRATGRPG